MPLPIPHKLSAPGVLTVLPLTKDDLEGFATTHFKAMKDTDLRSRLWPVARRRDDATMISHNIHTWSTKPTHIPYILPIKAVLPATSTPVGYAIWHSPIDRTSTGGDSLSSDLALMSSVAKTEKTAVDTEIEEYTDKAFQALWDEGAREARKRVMKGKPHWFLDGLFVDPEYQGRGIGQVLLAWGLEQADQAGLPCYLETSPQGLPLYLKNGFEIADYVVLPDNLEQGKEFRKPVMLRAARTL